MNYEVVRNDSYLQHFGIKGMKWGVWNEETRDRYLGRHKGKSSEVKVSNKKAKSNGDASSKHKGLTDKQKKYIKIGAGVAATILVAYGGYKLSTSPYFKSAMLKGLDKVKKSPSVDELIEQSLRSEPEIVRKSNIRGDIVTDSGHGRSYWDSETEIVGTFSEKAKARIDKISNNIKSINSKSNDSGDCTVASTIAGLPEEYQGKYTAKSNQYDNIDDVQNKIFEGARFKRPIIGSEDPKENYDSVLEDLMGFQEGAKGSIIGKVKDGGEGHILNWEKVDNQIIFYDADTNVIRDANNMYEHMFKHCDPTTVVFNRYDNRKINKKALNSFLDESTYEGPQNKAKEIINTLNDKKKAASVSSGIGAGGIVISSKVREQKIINDYKKEHPNTKMSSKEILESYRNNKGG